MRGARVRIAAPRGPTRPGVLRTDAAVRGAGPAKRSQRDRAGVRSAANGVSSRPYRSDGRAGTDAFALRCRREGLTMVELLVALTIFGGLLALLMPALQSAREAARVTQCHNSLRQPAMACLTFQESQEHLPGNGWGHRWTGDPDRGLGPQQPGG